MYMYTCTLKIPSCIYALFFVAVCTWISCTTCKCLRKSLINTRRDIVAVAEDQPDLPQPKSMRVENKMFYFDVGQNRRGMYMRISEVVSPNYHQRVHVPSLQAFAQSHHVFCRYVNK